jgi:hypothetical protein
MSEIASVITFERFAQGLTFEGYLSSIGENQARFVPHIAAFNLSRIDAQFFRDVVTRVNGMKVVAIGEDWCPDVHRGLPIIAKIAQDSGMDLHFFPRDKNLDIMNLFLNQGKYQSIPVFAFFDSQLKYLCHWTERPAVATRFQDEIRAELAKQKLGEEETRKMMREKTAPLVDSWRQETVKELKELLAQATIGH